MYPRLVSNSEFSASSAERTGSSHHAQSIIARPDPWGQRQSPGIRDKGLHMTDGAVEDWCLVRGVINKELESQPGPQGSSFQPAGLTLQDHWLLWTSVCGVIWKEKWQRPPEGTNAQIKQQAALRPRHSTGFTASHNFAPWKQFSVSH